MKRGSLALGAAVVVAALVVLYVVLRMDDGAGQRQDAAAAVEPVGPRKPETVPGKPVHAPAGDTSEKPAGNMPASSDAVREQTIGGVHVRDHRGGDHPPLEIPPAIHVPGGRKIAPQLTSAIAQQLRAVVRRCAANVSPADRGPTARVDGQLMIAIKDHQVAVTSAVMQLRDVAGAALGAVKQCIEQGSVGLTAPPGDEPDLEGYAITVSIGLS